MPLTLTDVEPLFELPSKEAAKILGISNNHLKRMCRRIGIERWPHRKIRSLKRLKERTSGPSSLIIEQEIARLKQEPNSDVSNNIKNVIAATYKSPHSDIIGKLVGGSIKSVDESVDESIIDSFDDEYWRQCLNILLQDPPKTHNDDIVDDNPIEQPDTPVQGKECILSPKFVQNRPPVLVACPILPLLSTSGKRLDG